ncbi:MAG: DUF3892 domain-containing protein [Bacillota bacterium]|nr:DUF3892 domain-containing protein [Bacillota bacterium]
MGDIKNKIIKVKKNSDGDIINVMLDNGSTYSVEDAIKMAKDHQIEGVNAAKSKSGKEYLRGNPNGNPEDNLDNLSTFD